MRDSLDIAEVARLTGLTSRALRFYEARGLVTPLRTGSGRRHYGPAELERLHQIVAMKRAGLTLTQIQRLAAGRALDLRALVATQLEVLAEREHAIANSRALLQSILSRIDRSEPIDVATFCSLIRQGEITMSEEKWAEIQQRYMSQEQRDAFEQAYTALPADFDHEAHHAKFKDLDRRIVAALPMDPASPQAQAFLDEWGALIEPFIAVAPPAMLEGMMNMLGNIEEWVGEADPGFSVEAYRFHQAAHEARIRMEDG
jgi:MerR family transcriptional regulator, thiopeptide resistance regulator